MQETGQSFLLGSVQACFLCGGVWPFQAEHARIEGKYQQQLGNPSRSLCPAGMDAAYLDRLAADWQHMAPPLGLEALTKNTGHLMQAAISGPDGQGTMLVDVFSTHRHKVHDAMTAKKPVQVPGFDALQADLVRCLHLNTTPASPENLTAEQQAVITPAKDIQAAFQKLFSALDVGLSTNDATKVKTVLMSLVTDVGRMAQSEIEAAKVEESLDYRRSLHVAQIRQRTTVGFQAACQLQEHLGQIALRGFEAFGRIK